MMPETMTDRQERIPDFRQSLLSGARVCVCGGGRTGNEVIKNLALTAFGTLFVTDMDRVADTNLPGTVLFSRADVGQSKARLAADGFARMRTGSGGTVDWLDADLCYTLGEGVFRQYDIIINCVDNLETRLYLCRIAKLLGKPCIDTGIDGFDWTLFVASGEPEDACYACSMTAEQEDAALSRVRNSCDVTLKKAAAEGRAATIITSAAQVGAVAVDRAVKILHHRFQPDLKAYDPRYGRMSLFSSAEMKLRSVKIPVRCDCTNHVSYADFGGVTKTPLSARCSLRHVLEWVRSEYGEGARLSLLKDCVKIPNRALVTTAKCKHCGRAIDVYRPQFLLEDEDLRCDACKEKDCPVVRPSEGVRIYDFSLASAEPRLLDMTLLEIGIPLAHIVEIDFEDEEKLPLFLELTADLPEVLPALCSG